MSKLCHRHEFPQVFASWETLSSVSCEAPIFSASSLHGQLFCPWLSRFHRKTTTPHPPPFSTSEQTLAYWEEITHTGLEAKSISDSSRRALVSSRTDPESPSTLTLTQGGDG
ncbi:hypothetical protein BaRGS_00006185 [Batillaria attramentaria]|uniref:Uncharacterized protein n=1 Tax=Batillaria attramentaria TaxID=370345 RepID=A0ABD0LSP8_9CAEN